MKHFFLSGLMTLLCGLNSSVYADTRWYQVELIVFGQIGKSSEVFAQTSSRTEWPIEMKELAGTPLPLAELQLSPQAYVTLQRADWSLSAADQTLHLQGGYKPLLHVAWVQPLEDGLPGQPVHIHDGGQSGEKPVLDGIVTIENGDPFNLLADLEYTLVTHDAETIVYRLRERRPLRLDEVHYLDHPKFGVIARVSSLQ